MKDTGRWRICIEIAKYVPYSTETVYDVYTYVLEQSRKRTNVVMLDKQLQHVKTILEFAQFLQLSPMTLAINIFEINES